MKKLELKYLAPYLPYGILITKKEWNSALKMACIDDSVLETISMDTIIRINALLILRSLSDLTKEIEHNGERFIPINKLIGLYGWDILWKNRNDISNINTSSLPYATVKHLFEWHFDVFGLIDAGLAIYKNKLSDRHNMSEEE